MTRDRVSYDANWNGRAFTVVDTGGWDPDARGLAERIARPGRDRGRPGRRGAVRGRRDRRHHRRRRGGRQDPARSPASRSCWPPTRSTTSAPRPRPRAVEPRPGGAVPGLRAARPRLGRHARRRTRRAARAAAGAATREVGGPRRIAIVGKPNVGKSSLLNKLAGEERVVVDNVAGTTVDPVDELIELGGRTWRFIDTAGIRKRVKEASGHEYYASLRTSTAIDRAEVAVLVLDGGAVDLRAGRPDPADRPRGRPGAGDRVQQVGPRRRGAPLLPRRARSSASWCRCSGRRGSTSPPAPAGTSTGWSRRWTRRSRAGRPGSRPARSTRSSAGWSPSTRTRCAAASSRRSCSAPRPSTAPPTFVLFTSGKLDASYERLHRAPAARGVRLRRHPDRAPAAAPGEAQALAGDGDACACSGLARWPDRRPAGCRRCPRPPGPPSAAARRPSRSRAPPARSSRPTTGGTPTSATCRCTPAAGSGSRTCRPSVDLHPDFGPSYGDGPELRHPDHGRGRRPPQGAGAVRLRRARATGCATRSAGTPGSRAAAARTATSTRSSSTRARCRLYETFDTRCRNGRWRAGSGAVWTLKQQPAAPRRLDLRRRRRAADPARPAALERGPRPARSTTRSGSPPTSPATHHLWPARHDAGLRDSPATRRWARGSGCRPASRPRLRRRRRAVIRAMKKYGLVLADNGSPWFFQGERSALAGPADRGPQADPGPGVRRRRHVVLKVSRDSAQVR